MRRNAFQHAPVPGVADVEAAHLPTAGVGVALCFAVTALMPNDDAAAPIINGVILPMLFPLPAS